MLRNRQLNCCVASGHKISNLMFVLSSLKPFRRFICYCFLFFLFSSCKTLHLNNLCKLPKILNESSGLVITKDNHFWSHNDSGGKPELYEIDSTGKLTRTLKIIGVKNNDWEEITLDKQDNLYIGDIGNNANKRRNLAIYKIAQFSAIKTDSIGVEKITFRYEDQFDYPPVPAFKHFDAEAMLVIRDSIFIFTKDFYTRPYSGKSRVYVIPNKPGDYTARLVKVLETDKSSRFNGAITGAAMSDDGKVALLSYERLWIFSDFSSLISNDANIKKPTYNAQIQPIHIRKFSFGKLQFTQREGVAFAPHSNCRLFFTSEKSLPFSGHLSSTDICKNVSKSNEVLVMKN